MSIWYCKTHGLVGGDMCCGEASIADVAHKDAPRDAWRDIWDKVDHTPIPDDAPTWLERYDWIAVMLAAFGLGVGLAMAVIARSL